MPANRLLAVLALAACSPSTPESPTPEPEVEPPLEPLQKGAFHSATASSFLDGERSSFPPDYAFDGDRSTAWCEGADGLGTGESLTVTLKSRTELAKISIDGGYFKDDRTLTNNGRPRKLAVASDAGWSHEVEFPFVPYREHKAKEIKVRPQDIEAPGAATTLTFTLLESDEGRASKDVCISEIRLFEAR